MEEHYRYYEGQKATFVDGAFLFQNPVSGKVAVADKDVALAARQCDRFASISDHASRIAGDSPECRQATERYLIEAAESGVLVSLREVNDRVLHGMGAGPRTEKTIDRIGISTCDRPNALSRLLTELAAHLDRYARNPEVVVVDDSRGAASTNANRAVATAVTGGSALNVRYLSRRSRARFSRILAEECGMPETVLAFAFTGGSDLPFTAGACRNSILASSLGRRVLLMDDDVVPKLIRVPGSDGRSEFGLAPGSHTQSFLSGWEDLDRLDPVECDLVGVHEKLFNQTADDADLSHIGLSLLKQMERPSRVVVSCMGVWGDPGFDHPLPYFTEDHRSLLGALRDGGGLNGAIRNRTVIRGLKETAVTDSTGCMAYCMGVDNTELLPPFLPAMRAEEMVWSRLVRAAVPGALVAFAPWAIRHDPLPSRRFEPDAATSNAGRFTAGELLALLVSTLNPRGAVGSTAEARMRSAGARLIEIADCDPADFRNAVKQAAEPACATRLRRIDSAALAMEGPWKEELARVCDVILDAWKRGRHGVAVDLERLSGEDVGMTRFQNLVQEFGTTLRSWPDILSAVAMLREKGISITEEDAPR